MASLVCTRFRMHGPMSRPAMISPTTCGALHLRATRPKNFALRMIIARSRKTKYTKNPSFTIKFSELYIHSFRRRITESRETADPRLPCRSSSESDYIIALFHQKIKIFFVVCFFQKPLDRSFTACYNKLLSEQTRRTQGATPRFVCTLGPVIAGPLSPKGGATKWQSTKPC